jgi:ABC-2 type transport system ATP-binding protein
MNNDMNKTLRAGTAPWICEGYDPAAPILSCVNLNKSYIPARPVLHNLNISLTGGKIVGLLGPNGCGKSTLLKLISGILVPDSGTIEICGIPQSETTNSLVSFLPERTYFNSWMKVDQLIAFFADFYPDFDEAMARKMFSDLSIDVNAKLRTLSKGNKEKVQLVLVMSRRARLYLLDEPIGGVDPAARDYILSTIIGSYNPDAAVIITTHLIHDIEPILDEFAFMGYGGRILLDGIADEVRAEKGKSLDELFREVFRC